jgi:hypothetical protein
MRERKKKKRLASGADKGTAIEHEVVRYHFVLQWEKLILPFLREHIRYQTGQARTAAKAHSSLISRPLEQ